MNEKSYSTESICSNVDDKSRLITRILPFGTAADGIVSLYMLGSMVRDFFFVKRLAVNNDRKHACYHINVISKQFYVTGDKHVVAAVQSYA